MKPMRENNHAMNDRDVIDLALEHQDVDQGHRGRMILVEIGSGSLQSTNETIIDEFPWTAPRVISQHLEHDMNTTIPTPWAIDNYDGSDSLRERAQQPRDNCKDDREMSSNQYNKFLHILHQMEEETDEITQKRKAGECEGWIQQERQKVQNDVKKDCMEIYAEVELGEAYEERINRRIGKQELALSGCATRCESLRFPMIVDPGACAPAMPKGWGEHVPLKETPQPKAGEHLRAAEVTRPKIKEKESRR